MANAMNEFIGLFNSFEEIPQSVVCAHLEYRPYYDDDNKYTLMVDYTPDQLASFLKSLDFHYDAGFGMQHLYGYIWLKHGAWYERHEYDGAEGWVRKQTPRIPDDCYPIGYFEEPS